MSLVDIRLSLGSLVGDSYSWLCDPAMGGGALNLFGAHLADLVHFLLDEKVSQDFLTPN